MTDSAIAEGDAVPPPVAVGAGMVAVSATVDGEVVAPPVAVGLGIVTVNAIAEGVAVASPVGLTAIRIAAWREFDASAVQAPGFSDDAANCRNATAPSTPPTTSAEMPVST